MKNKFLIIFITYFFLQGVSISETFKFETKNIEILENGELIYANDGKVFSSDKNLELEAEKFEYKKKLDILNAYNNGSAIMKSENLKIEFDKAVINQKKSTIQATGNVKVYQPDKNLIIESDKIIYNQNSLILQAIDNVKIFQTKKNLVLETSSITYNKINSTIDSSNKSKLTDNSKNIYDVESFLYEIDKDLLKIKNVKFKDINNNRFSTSLAFINTKTNKLFGKDININLNNKSFNKDNEPRLKGNSVINDNNSTEITKGIFTTCKKRKDDKCPPWQISAKKIQHNKKDKTMYYDEAWLKVYDLPVMYFPKFFHPDPNVKRRSGFLIPTFKSSSNTSNYLNLPYFLAIADHKDATFSPRFYDEDQLLLQTEYRQVGPKSNHISDFSFFAKKNDKDKNHFFYEYQKNFNINIFQDSNFDFKIQQTSNDTYLKANKFESEIIDDTNVLENSFKLNLYSNDLSIDAEMTAYEDLNESNSDRFEFILPKLDLVKKINNDSNLNGDLTFKSSNLVRNYNTNIFEKKNVNDLLFSSFPKITNMGFYNNYDLLLKNSNTDSQKSENYIEGDKYYLSGLFQFNSSLPLIKENNLYQNILKPKISLKISPNNTKDISKQTSKVDVNNIYGLNRISENDTIEGGISITYGNDYSIFNKKRSKEVFNLKIANNLRFEENNDLQKNDQLNQKTSSIFSEIVYSPIDYLTTKYNSSVKNNLSEINYENLIAEITLNKFVTTFDYLNENNIDNGNSYLTNSTKYLINDSNSIGFSTRENKTSDLTEYYNLIYQYKNDCLSASIEYNKDYYTDRDIKPAESIFFKLTIIPFGETTSPNLKN